MAAPPQIAPVALAGVGSGIGSGTKSLPPRAAGQAMEAFGNFVVGGNYVIGLAIFLVLIAIQYVVINHRAALPVTPSPRARESLDSVLKVEPLSLEVGLGLVKMAEGGQNSPLLLRIAGIRKQMATDAGSAPTIDGIATREPAFGIPAVWIPADEADSARAKGYAVVDPVSVLGKHLAEPIRRHAHELLSRQDTKNILERVSDENPKVIGDLVPKLHSLAVVQKVLQNLPRERVSMRDAVFAPQRPRNILDRITRDLEPATKKRLAACVAGRDSRSTGAVA
jgi:flagellar biosynthesis component FlhA